MCYAIEYLVRMYALVATYSQRGAANIRSNRRAVDFNLAIRGIIYGHEEILAPGERLMVAKNNYYWTRGHQQVDFIANGEVAVVERIARVASLPTWN